MSAWSCPHLDADGRCRRVLGRPCELGMKGCVLAGRFVFADESKNRPRRGGTPGAPPALEDEQER